MGNRVKALFISVLVTFLATHYSIAQSRAKDRILDKKQFTISLHLKDDKRETEPINDQLNFRSNKAWSNHLQSLSNGGFLRGDYAILSKEELLGEYVYHFQIINKNAKGMSLKWDGRYFGDQVEGTAIISKKGKVKEEYTFSGSLKD